MLSSLSSNAILSKARAMYGRRLTKENYKDLLACQSVSEVTYYLKNRTAYSKILSGVNESDVHRGQLEGCLKQKLFEDSASLCRYEITLGEHFSEYLIERGEIEEIMHSIMLIIAGHPEEYIFTMPGFLDKHSRIDLSALGRVKTYDDLLNALSHTTYRKLLEPFKPVPGIPLNYTGIEKALYTHLYKRVYDIINKHTHGETKKQLLELFDSYIDMENYARILRLKFNYQAGPDFIRSCLFAYGTLQGRRLEPLLMAENREDVMKAFAKTSIGKRVSKMEDASPDETARQVKYLTCRHDIRFSTHPCVVMLSYIFISQIELLDITTIIEGIRYNLSSDEIAKLLTIINFQ